MFNPEKLLGGLLGQSSGLARGTGTKATVGLGLLGVAMEAAEHFMNKSQASAAPTIPPPPPSGAQAAPPPPPGSTPAVPPPLPPNPGVKGANEDPEPAVSPPPLPKALNPQERDAVLLIRAMIAAANADGHIDAEERSNILEKLENGEALSHSETTRLTAHHAANWGQLYSAWLQDSLGFSGGHNSSIGANFRFAWSIPGSSEWMEEYGQHLYPPEFVGAAKSFADASTNTRHN